ncbi:hypothetical protein EJB05_35806 [Eragrostis curvula]|uniref:Cyclin-dependent kinase inhibitor domain-containing protein n=1 Tax=Eragrostis curvula TaxID=38414 RepID=A0A5J9U7Q1_9POAL|nr:hypothetical protein EJB05_58116 [Eragrostis curvula]TVU19643.1 hypothetical protein EJB05_35806 [Eragrostis curvula]
MAAAAATATAALASCTKHDSDIVGTKMPKKTKRGRSPPEEQVEAFFTAAESDLARRFAAK